MQSLNPFFPKHQMVFKVGGASLNPMDSIIRPEKKGSLDKWKGSIFNPKVDIEQTKNAVSGKGFQTDAALAADAAAAQAAATPQVSSMNAANAESLNAEQDVRRNALRNMGFLKTTYAGETGGWKPTAKQ